MNLRPFERTRAPIRLRRPPVIRLEAVRTKSAFPSSRESSLRRHYLRIRRTTVVPCPGSRHKPWSAFRRNSAAPGYSSTCALEQRRELQVSPTDIALIRAKTRSVRPDSIFVETGKTSLNWEVGTGGRQLIFSMVMPSKASRMRAGSNSSMRGERARAVATAMATLSARSTSRPAAISETNPASM